MALSGQGVLAIWNDIAPEAEREFVSWHVAEHIPERVGLPGFLRGRRYVAEDGKPKYFNFYEATTADVFSSSAYKARLNAPTDWTQRVVRHFANTCRTVCGVAYTSGTGEGAWIEAIRIKSPESEDLIEVLRTDMAPRFSAEQGFVGLHVLRGIIPPTPSATAETKLRSGPDTAADVVVLVEAVSLEVIRTARASLLPDGAIRGSRGVQAIDRGAYQLQFSLSNAELNAN